MLSLCGAGEEETAREDPRTSGVAVSFCQDSGVGRESQVDRESVRNFRQVMGSRVRRGGGWRQGARRGWHLWGLSGKRTVSSA